MVLRLGAVKRAEAPDAELERLGRVHLLIVDEVGHIPFDPEARAPSSPDLQSLRAPVSRGELHQHLLRVGGDLGDPVAVAAMVDRLVHHAEVPVPWGDSYRPKGKGKHVLPSRGLRECPDFDPRCFQAVIAPLAIKTSLGDCQFRIRRGLSLSSSAMAFRSAAECTDRPVPLGRYWRNRPLVFSLEPRCQGDRASQKKTGIFE